MDQLLVVPPGPHGQVFHTRMGLDGLAGAVVVVLARIGGVLRGQGQADDLGDTIGRNLVDRILDEGGDVLQPFVDLVSTGVGRVQRSLKAVALGLGDPGQGRGQADGLVAADQLVHERLGRLLPMADIGVVPLDVGLLVGGAVSHEEDSCRFSH